MIKLNYETVHEPDRTVSDEAITDTNYLSLQTVRITGLKQAVTCQSLEVEKWFANNRSNIVKAPFISRQGLCVLGNRLHQVTGELCIS